MAPNLDGITQTHLTTAQTKIEKIIGKNFLKNLKINFNKMDAFSSMKEFF